MNEAIMNITNPIKINEKVIINEVVIPKAKIIKYPIPANMRYAINIRQPPFPNEILTKDNIYR